MNCKFLASLQTVPLSKLDRHHSPGFQIRLVPTPRYHRHISLACVWFQIVFAWKVCRRAMRESSPDCIIAINPPQSIGYVAVKLARHLRTRLTLNVPLGSSVNPQEYHTRHQNDAVDRVHVNVVSLLRHGRHYVVPSSVSARFVLEPARFCRPSKDAWGTLISALTGVRH